MAPPKRISKERVLAAVADVFGPDRAPSMDEIAAAAGVSRAAIYQLFGNRGAALAELGLRHPTTGRDRIVKAAAEILAERGLAGLSFDDVAVRAGASRATVYRLFPGKAALYGEVVRRCLPVEDVFEALGSMRDRPPAEVMPALAVRLAELGYVGIGVLRSVLFDLTGQEDGTEEVVQGALRNTAALTGYLEDQMAAGRLRRMHPILAMQGFLAPIMFHVVHRPLADDYDLLGVSLEEAVREFTAAWLRGMTPPRQRRGRSEGAGAPSPSGPRRRSPGAKK